MQYLAPKLPQKEKKIYLGNPYGQALPPWQR